MRAALATLNRDDFLCFEALVFRLASAGDGGSWGRRGTHHFVTE
jgi:hypothetical protein